MVVIECEGPIPVKGYEEQLEEGEDQDYQGAAEVHRCIGLVHYQGVNQLENSSQRSQEQQFGPTNQELPIVKQLKYSPELGGLGIWYYCRVVGIRAASVAFHVIIISNEFN